MQYDWHGNTAVPEPSERSNKATFKLEQEEEGFDHNRAGSNNQPIKEMVIMKMKEEAVAKDKAIMPTMAKLKLPRRAKSLEALGQHVFGYSQEAYSQRKNEQERRSNDRVHVFIQATCVHVFIQATCVDESRNEELGWHPSIKNPTKWNWDSIPV
jgi:hypothetical protein